MFLPDFMDANPLLLPIFPLSLVSSGRDYTGLDNLPQGPACMCSFIKTHKCRSPPTSRTPPPPPPPSLACLEWTEKDTIELKGSTCRDDGFYYSMSLIWYPWRARVWIRLLSYVLLPLCNAAVTEVEGPRMSSQWDGRPLVTSSLSYKFNTVNNVAGRCQQKSWTI